MDAPSSYFFSLEKKSGQSRLIHCLLSDAGQELTETSQIRRRAVSFYFALYASEYQHHEELFNSFCEGLPKASQDSNKLLDQPFTLSELYTALQSMQGQKAPGIDGVTVEFFIGIF
ncbi:hypothetical protein LDENG_00003490 [Lucifuga dentata]|nr:hypothetical protein LDENG_00003490 [Lucifuga dentata]